MGATVPTSRKTSPTTNVGLRATLRCARSNASSGFPPGARDRMRNMFKGRPDWCVSRQRVWGVSIPVFYCAKCTEAVADPDDHQSRRRHLRTRVGRRLVHARGRELLPEGYKCKKCGAEEWTKETDILDVWFDSGASSIAVLENREELALAG